MVELYNSSNVYVFQWIMRFFFRLNRSACINLIKKNTRIEWRLLIEKSVIKICIYSKFLTSRLNCIAIVLEDQTFKVAESVRDRR